jgi:hypothetical protein
MSDSEDWDERWDWCKREAEKILLEIMDDSSTVKQYKHAKLQLQSSLSSAWSQGELQRGKRPSVV